MPLVVQPTVAPPVPPPVAPSAHLAAIPSHRSFFLVFYGSDCFSRMNMYYDHCMGIGACTLEWAALVKLHLPVESKGMQWNAMRL